MDKPCRASKFWKPPLALFLTLAVAIASTGCGVRELARGEIQPPRVTFRGLTIYKPTSQGWPLAAILLLDNPNPRPLNLLGYDYQLSLEGKQVAQGASREAVNLPPLGQTVAEFPIVVQLPAVLQLLPQVLPRQFLSPPKQQAKLRYEIAGSFRLASVVGGLIPVPFRFQGEVTPREGLDFLRPYLR